MNEEALLHIPDSKFCFAIDDKTMVIRLRVSKKDSFDSIDLIYGNKYNFYKKQKSVELLKKFSDNLFDYYITKLTLKDVRLVYIFKIVEKGKVYYFSEDGVTSSYDFSLAYYNSFQFPYINLIDVHKKVEWMQNAVFYQIFVDRFFMGDDKKDKSYINLKWGDLPSPQSFAGGDIIGIIKKIDYLKKLGVNVLYLTPVFCSISNHKYDISDYYNIDKQFGANEDFLQLVNTCHENGIRVVMDAVFNHCSENLPQFQDVLKNGKNSPYFNWFIINGDSITSDKSNFECFASCKYMPKFNTSNKETQNFLIDIATSWINKYNIDGWRLDVSDEVSHNFWFHFRESVKTAKNDCVIIGENWHDANPFLQGDEYDGIMNYALTKAMLDFFAENSLSATALCERLSGLLMRNTDQVNSMMLNILDSHDTHRFLTKVNGREDKLICALSVIFMFIGAPGIYYGTEIGMKGGYDPDCRRTFDWSKANKQTELLKIIKGLIKLKKRKELQIGEVSMFSSNNLFILERRYKNKIVRLTLNNSDVFKDFTSTDKIILSYNFSSNIINSAGFVIEEVREIK